MNGDEQRAHRSALAALKAEHGKRLDDLETLLAEFDERLSGVASAASDEIARKFYELQQDNYLLNGRVAELESELRAAQEHTATRLDTFRAMGFLERWRWLLGGLPAELELRPEPSVVEELAASLDSNGSLEPPEAPARHAPCDRFTANRGEPLTASGDVAPDAICIRCGFFKSAHKVVADNMPAPPEFFRPEGS